MNVVGFTARAAPLRRHGALLPAGQPQTAVVIVAVDGTPGIGRTALAVHQAHGWPTSSWTANGM